jgi:hypothetical protein
MESHTAFQTDPDNTTPLTALEAPFKADFPLCEYLLFIRVTTRQSGSLIRCTVGAIEWGHRIAVGCGSESWTGDRGKVYSPHMVYMPKFFRKKFLQFLPVKGNV